MSKEDTKNFVLDTNVLLNDPTCINKFNGNNIIIPFVVLEEIDNFKKGNHPLASAARSVCRILDNIRTRGKLSEGVKLDNGGILMVPDMCPIVSFTDSSSANNDNDNIILQTCKDLDDKTDNTVLITEDINLRVKASAIGIEAQKHEASRVHDTSFYDSTNFYKVEDNTINDLHYYDEAYAEDIRKHGETLENNEYFVLQGFNSGSALGAYKGGKIVRVKEKQCYGLSPRNKEQIFALDALTDPSLKLVILAGPAGCGKTLISLAAGLEQTFEKGGVYDGMTIARPTVSMGQDLGYLPGNLDEKLDPWMAPIYDNIAFLHGKSGYTSRGKQLLKDLNFFGKIDITALSYIRGRSISNQFVLVDEAQNLNSHEIKTIVTRIGRGSKLVITGDPNQIDNPYLDHGNNALSYLIDRMKGEELFSSVVLTEGERSELAEIAAKKL